MTREEIQKLFIRTCRDSGFQLSATEASIFCGKLVGISPLEFWLNMPSMDVMEKIANGSHPAAKR